MEHYPLMTVYRIFPIMRTCGRTPEMCFCWEVLSDVGVDGVGETLPLVCFFFPLFFAFLRFSLLFFAFLSFS